MRPLWASNMTARHTSYTMSIIHNAIISSWAHNSNQLLLFEWLWETRTGYTTIRYVIHLIFHGMSQFFIRKMIEKGRIVLKSYTLVHIRSNIFRALVCLSQ